MTNQLAPHVHDLAPGVHDLAPRVLERLDRESIVWICTLRPDGSPHLSPVWFLYREEGWWICSGRETRKVRNVSLEPRVSLALEEGRAPVVAEGRAIVIAEPFPAEIVQGFKLKYGGWDITEQCSVVGPRVLLHVPVTRWLFMGMAQ